jgi:hypothetical protein
MPEAGIAQTMFSTKPPGSLRYRIAYEMCKLELIKWFDSSVRQHTVFGPFLIQKSGRLKRTE